MKELLDKHGKIIALYSLWVLMHLIFYFVSDKSYSTFFWPFEGEADFTRLKYSYDMSEFLVYAISPAVLFFVYLMFTKKD